jgi:ankyrin repeat protein
MMSVDTFSELESHIRWGCVDSSRQTKVFQTLQSCPALATDEDEFGQTLLMIVNQLCLLGSNTRALASTGDTPLICAVAGARDDPPEAEVSEVRSAIIDTLIQFGADPGQLGRQGCSALHYAVIYGFVELVRHLLIGGADPMVRLCDPPSDESSIELAESDRFYGTDQQRHAIIGLLKNG